MSLNIPVYNCPNCGKYTSQETGFFDRVFPYDETSELAVYCNEHCADAQREKDEEKLEGLQWEPDRLYAAQMAYACGYHD